MNFLGMGPMELMVILVMALVIFGPGKLPEIAGQVGRVVRDFRRMTGDLSSEFNRTLSLEIEERKAAQAPAPPAPPPIPTLLPLPKSPHQPDRRSSRAKRPSPSPSQQHRTAPSRRSPHRRRQPPSLHRFLDGVRSTPTWRRRTERRLDL